MSTIAIIEIVKVYLPYINWSRTKQSWHDNSVNCFVLSKVLFVAISEYSKLCSGWWHILISCCYLVEMQSSCCVHNGDALNTYILSRFAKTAAWFLSSHQRKMCFLTSYAKIWIRFPKIWNLLTLLSKHKIETMDSHMSLKLWRWKSAEMETSWLSRRCTSLQWYNSSSNPFLPYMLYVNIRYIFFYSRPNF